MSNLYAVMETYAGKSKELVKCEYYMRQIIDLINKDYENKRISSKYPIHREAEPCKKLEETLAKFFNVGSIKIYWNSGVINAYSVPGSSMLIANRNTSGDFTSAQFHICLYENLVYHAGLNEKEMMAILLHEIGHCFYSSSLLVAGELLSFVMSPMSIVVLFIGTGIIKFSNFLIDLEKRKIPGGYRMVSKYNNFMLQTSYFLTYLLPIGKLSGVLQRTSINLANPLMSLGKYGGERGADSFATKYGYGSDLITGLKKLERPENVVVVKGLASTGGFGDFMFDYNEIMNSLYGMISLDPHPNCDVRAQATLRKLKRDLNSGDYPPELKKELEAEIRRLEKIYETLYDNKSNVQIKKAWFNMLNAITNGHSNLQEILNSYYENNEF